MENNKLVISRRHFLKLGGLAAASVVMSGCTAKLQQGFWIESHIHPPEETLPGEDLWFASACRMCPAACGITARLSNGRVRKLEGNPQHPLNQGRLCARGQAGLQQLYHPDRLQQILVRAGERGQRQWGTTSWEEIINQIAGQLKQTDPGRIAFFTGLLPQAQAALVQRFSEGLGALPPVIYDAQSALDGRTVLQTAAEQLFDTAALPVYDIARADAVFTFGSNFLESELSPVSYTKAYGEMRSRPGQRGLFVAFEPRLSMTAANADAWVPLTPGSEGVAALALGKIILDNDWGRSDAAPYKPLYQNVDVNQIAQITGIPVERLTSLARTFAQSRRPAAMPGGQLAGYDNGLEAAQAVMLLNLLAGREEPAIYLPPQPPSRDLTPIPPNAFADAAELTQKMAAGEIDILFILGTNPIYELPPGLEFAAALDKVKQVIDFAVLPDETTALADIVLPAHTYLETWGYEFVNPATEKMVVSAQQPIVQPLYDSRDPADALLALADALGGDAARRLPWPNLVTFIQTRLTSLQLLDGNIKTDNTDAFWAYWLQNGGWWSDETMWQPLDTAVRQTPFMANLPAFAGEESDYPYHLLPVPSLVFGDGRHAGLPWLQETPDPMTTAAWDTWVELSPETARRIGVQNNDVLSIQTPAGQLQAIAYIYPGIQPETIAIPIGQGHTALGRWAAGRGANVLQVLAGQTAVNTGQIAWAATRAQAAPVRDQSRPLPVIESNIGVEYAREMSK